MLYRNTLTLSAYYRTHLVPTPKQKRNAKALHEIMKVFITLGIAGSKQCRLQILCANDTIERVPLSHSLAGFVNSG